jgi:hypothetical protein
MYFDELLLQGFLRIIKKTYATSNKCFNFMFIIMWKSFTRYAMAS